MAEGVFTVKLTALAPAAACRSARFPIWAPPAPSFPVLTYLRAGGPMCSLAVRMPGAPDA
jgi:hypothetical protein